MTARETGRRPGRRSFLVAAAALVVLGPVQVTAQEAEIAGPIVLEIEVQGRDTVRFDIAALEALPQQSFSTTTIWTEGAIEFSGPSLTAVLGVAGLGMEPVYAYASNGYGVTLTFPPGDELSPIIATRIDGEPISRREKGPLWVMFPFDNDAALRNAEVFGQSIWHLVRLSDRPDSTP
jgi:hypothetical protein